MKVTKIDRAALKNIRPLVDAALAPLGETMGIKFHAGNCSFGANDFTFKLEGRLPGTDGVFVPKEHQDFKVGAWTLGLEPEDLGRKFEFQGKVFTIDGLKPRSTKYPILGKNAKGKRYKFRPQDVKRGLL